jgi:hypothetical protein
VANGGALIQESLWRNNREFRELPRSAQCTYVQLCSTRDLDCAGQLTLNVAVLAKACDELTIEHVWRDLKILETARFIFVDTDTDEMLIRSYVRLVSARSPNAYKAALRAAKLISSPKLRHELALELLRLNRSDAASTAAEIDPVQTPSEPHRNGVHIPSERGIPSGSHPEPPVPVPVRYQYSPSVVGSVGEGPPARYCPKHMPDGTDSPCGACKDHRIAFEAWETTHQPQPPEPKTTPTLLPAEQEARRRAGIPDCPLCDDNGDAINDNGEPLGWECSHPQWAIDRHHANLKTRAAQK